MVRVGLLTLVSHLTGLPPTLGMGLPSGRVFQNISAPMLPTSPGGLPGQTSMTVGEPIGLSGTVFGWATETDDRLNHPAITMIAPRNNVSKG